MTNDSYFLIVNCFTLKYKYESTLGFPSEVFQTSELQPSTLSLSNMSWEASSSLFVPRTTGSNRIHIITSTIVVYRIGCKSWIKCFYYDKIS